MAPSYDQPARGGNPWFLYVERGPGAGQLIPVKQGPVVIGRASISDLRLKHPSISRRHAQLTRTGNRFYIRDLGSQNGTFVNKTKIAAEMEIYPGDEIAMGNALLKLHEAEPPSRSPVETRAPARPKPQRSSAALLSAEPTDRVFRPSPKGPSTMRVAIFAGVVGFGLAGVLMFALLKLPSGASQQEGQLRPPLVQLDAPPVVTQPPAEPSKPARDNDPPQRERAEKEREAEPPRPPPPEPIVKPTPAVAASKKSPLVAKTTAEDEKIEAKQEEPAPKKAVILAKYEEGDAAGALEMAKRGKDKDLVSKLGKFVGSYQAAREAMRAKNGTAAIRSFETALALDQALSSGWSKYGGEIRKELSALWTLVALTHVENDDEAAAKKALEVALKHDPSNTKAKAQLKKLATPKKTSPSSIDDAFSEEDEEKPAPKKQAAPKKDAVRNAIDDAWED
ncbi:MAG: FHA domain-containing protein [Myxococcota bacterium]